MLATSRPLLAIPWGRARHCGWALATRCLVLASPEPWRLREPRSDLCPAPQSDPELVQWRKELRDAQRQAQQLLQRVPRMQNKPRSPVVELSKVPFIQRSANGL